MFKSVLPSLVLGRLCLSRLHGDSNADIGLGLCLTTSVNFNLDFFH